MKKNLFLLSVCLLILYAAITPDKLPAQSSALPKVELSFVFERQSGFSSNQFAVWIEDLRGNLVKTLYATKFTASGGWAKRNTSLPLWVSKAGLSALGKAEIDALSRATPRNGALSCTWDGSGKNGISAPAGEYRIFLEATLKEDNRVVYSAPFTLGSGGAGRAEEAAVKTEYFGSRTKERGMIGGVKVIYRP
jgi:hypothetical protein